MVLGGSGFVGSAICKAAVSKGIEVISLSRCHKFSTKLTCILITFLNFCCFHFQFGCYLICNYRILVIENTIFSSIVFLLCSFIIFGLKSKTFITSQVRTSYLLWVMGRSSYLEIRHVLLFIP